MCQYVYQNSPKNYDKHLLIEMMNCLDVMVNRTKHNEVIMVLDKPNKNNHIYPTNVMKDILKDKIEILGYIGISNNILDLPVDKCSHKVYNLHIEDDKLLGNIEILKTPEGNNLLDMYKNGIQISYRTAGNGTFDTLDDGSLMIKTFELLSINAVPTEDAA